jgi:hypothetical protein
MPHAPCTFRETDVRRAIKAALSAGIKISRIEIGRDGRIVVVPGEPTKEECQGQDNPWDEVLTKNAEDAKRPS